MYKKILNQLILARKSHSHSSTNKLLKQRLTKTKLLNSSILSNLSNSSILSNSSNNYILNDINKTEIKGYILLWGFLIVTSP